MPLTRQNHSAVGMEDEMFVFGAYDGYDLDGCASPCRIPGRSRIVDTERCSSNVFQELVQGALQCQLSKDYTFFVPQSGVQYRCRMFLATSFDHDVAMDSVTSIEAFPDCTWRPLFGTQSCAWTSGDLKDSTFQPPKRTRGTHGMRFGISIRCRCTVFFAIRKN